MVYQRNADNDRGIQKRLCHGKVLSARRCIAAWVIVRYDNCVRPPTDRILEHLPAMNGRSVKRP